MASRAILHLPWRPVASAVLAIVSTREAFMTTNSALPVRPQALLDVSAPETLAAWMAESPDAFIGAVTSGGAPTEIPADIVLGTEHQTDERSLLEFVVPEDTKAVADAFVSALVRGIGITKIHMASDPTLPLLLRYLDLRETHGVLIRVVIAGTTHGEPERAFRTSAMAPARPRLGVMFKDEVAKILSIDTALGLMLGWAETDMVGHQNIEFIHPDDHLRAIDSWMSRTKAERVSTVQTVRLRYLCKDGSWLWLETSNESHLEADGTTVVVGTLFDVSEEMAAVEALRHNESFLRRVTDTVPVGLFHIASDGAVAFVNPVLQDLIGEREVHSVADLADALLSGKGSPLQGAIEEVMSDGIDADFDISLAERDHRARSTCRVNLRAITDDEAVLGVLGCVVDVTELRTMADTDALTGLQNRRSIMESLASDLVGHRGRVAAIYLDLDYFKPVNDNHGHHVGDQLLKAVAERLRDRIRPMDHVGRHGGDEFLILCPGISSQRSALGFARRLQEAFSEPFELSGMSIPITASVGVACGAPGVTADQLVSCADCAMYDAKRARGGPPIFIELLEWVTAAHTSMGGAHRR
jgi:diguanylate cyclase (GGDEF)-like protein/PAS domain S-box-containing protein